MIESGPLYMARSAAYQFADQAKKNNGDAALPMLVVGVITVAIGAVMVSKNGQKLWQQHLKDQAVKRPASSKSRSP